MKRKFILILIMLLGFTLRFYLLTDRNSSLYWDEVSIGYNAYSIIQTAKDEWGRPAPWFFEAFGEYKFPIAIYLTALPVRVFGLNDFAVRFPSAFLGTMSILVIYFLSKIIFNRKKISLMTAFLLSISPWSIQFGKGMFESNIGTFFLISALFLLITFLRKKSLLIFLLFLISSFLCIYSYGAILIIFPIVVVVTIIFFGSKKVKEKIKQILFLTIIISALYLPFVFHIRQNSYQRLNQVSIFSQNKVLEEIINQRQKYGILGHLLFNQYTAAMINFFQNFRTYINPEFLWPGKDGNPRHYNGFGLVYPIEILFLIIGFCNLLISKRKVSAYLLVFVLIPFAASSFTKDSPHALRSLSAVIPLALTTSYGLYILSKRKWVAPLIILSYLFFINVYLTKYFQHISKSFSSWGMENKIMAHEAKKYDQEKVIYITGDYWRPYIYYYFYSRISPEKIQRNNNSTRIGNIYFGYAKWDKADRRYDFNFKPESLFNEDNYVLFLSGSEKEFFSPMLFKENAVLKQDFYYNDSYMFSVYEK